MNPPIPPSHCKVAFQLQPVSKDLGATAWLPEIGICVGLVAATMFVYLQCASFEFLLLDDPVYVSGNRHVQAGLTRDGVVWSFCGFHDANWIPLTWLSLMADAQFLGLRPAGFHLNNVVLHALNAVLLYLLMRVATRLRWPGAAVAGLFTIHPLHVESVAWVAERKDVLSILFGLLCMLAYVDYTRRNRKSEYWLSLVLFCFSLMAKQTLVTLPFLLLIWDYWPLRRLRLGMCTREPNASNGERPGRLILEKLPFFTLSVLFSAVAMLAQFRGHAVASFQRYPVSTRLANAVLVYAKYVEKAFLPTGLIVYYPHRGDTWTAASVVIAAAILLAVSLIAIAALRRFPFLAVGWAWYLGTLIPMIGLVQIGGQQMADRYTYFPLIGVFVAVVWLLAAIWPQHALGRRILSVVAVGCYLALGYLSLIQIAYWHDGVRLFEHALACGPDNAFSRNQLGCARVQKGQLHEAIEDFEAATRLSPRFDQPQHNLGLVYQRLGRLDEAVAHYQAALAINDSYLDSHNNLGAIFYARRDYAGAKRHLKKVVEQDPSFALAWVNLALVSSETGNDAEAIEFSQRALELDPAQLNCRRILARALIHQRRFEEAIGQLQTLLVATPRDVDSQLLLQRLIAARRSSPSRGTNGSH